MSQDNTGFQLPASEALLDLIFLALDHGVNSVSEGGLLIPFLMAEAKGERELHRFVSSTLEEGIAAAKKLAAELPSTVVAYAIAYDGYLTMGDQRTDAIFVEGAERNGTYGLRFAQRYQPNPFQTIGNPAYLGECEQL